MNFIVSTLGLEIGLLALGVAFIWGGIKLSLPFFKHLLYNLAAIVIALFIYEAYKTFLTDNHPKTEIKYSADYFTGNKELGYSVRYTPFTITAHKFRTDNHRDIYKAKYSFKNGFRHTPNSDSLSQTHLIFLGGSCAFGEGLNDDETLPYFINQLSEVPNNVHNYGFHGYGTHQALTILKKDLIKNKALLSAKKVKVYYYFIPNHISRANGYSNWDKTGSWYELEQGSVVLKGNFSDKKKEISFFKRGWQQLIQGSSIYRIHLLKYAECGSSEMDLIYAMLSEMNLLCSENGFEFNVILEYNSSISDLMVEIKKYMKSSEISYFDLPVLLSEEKKNPDQLYIQGDLHPTARFNELAARHLIKEMLPNME